MFQKLPHISPSFWIKLCFVLIFGLHNSVCAQKYVNISLADPTSGNGNPFTTGALTDFLINPAGQFSAPRGMGWGANLYSASEVGDSNKIYDLTWFSHINNGAATYDFKDVDIWIYHFNQDFFPNGTRPDVQSGSIPGATNITKVKTSASLKFITPINAGNDCIFSLILDKPFDYFAGNNLVIYMEKRTAYTPTLISGPAFAHNTEPNGKTRRICNWYDGTLASPLPNTSNASSKSKFARVMFNVAFTNTKPLKGTKGGPIVNANGTPVDSDPIIECFPTPCTTPVVSNKTTTICSNTALNFIPTVTGTDVIPAGTIYKWTFTDNPKVTGEANETSGKTSITTSSNLIDTTKILQDVEYIVTPSSGTCVGTPFTLTVTVNPAPKISNITKTICSGQKFDTIPSASATNIIPNSTNYKWTHINNANVSGITDETSGKSSISSTVELINISNPQTSQNVVYNVTATSGESPNQCTSTFKVNITIKPKPTALSFISSDVKQPTCSATNTGSIKFTNLPTPGNYTIYSIPATASSPASYIGSSYTFTDLVKSTSYRFFLKESNACSSDTTAPVVMGAVPGEPFLEGANSLCVDSTLTLKAWTDNTKSKLSEKNIKTLPWISSDPTIATVDTDGKVTGKGILGGNTTITFRDTSNCTQSVSILVAPKALGGIAKATNDTICENASTAITLTNYTLSSIIQWQDSTQGAKWKNIQNANSATLNTPTSLVAGIYYYRAIVKNAFCTQYDTSKVDTVVVIGLPAPTFTNTDLIQPTCLVATGGVKSNMQYKGVWTIKATADPLSTGVTKDTTGTVNVIPYALSLNGLNPGKYTFQVTNSKGCTSNPSSEIEIKTQPTIPSKPALDADTIYCASNSYTLDKLVFKPKPNLSASIKYLDNNGVITTPSLVTILPNVVYKFVFNNGQCESNDTLKTIIPMDNGPTLPLSGGDIPLGDICAISKPTFNTLFSKLPTIDTSKYTFFISPNPTGTPILLNNATIGFNGGIMQTMYYTLADKKNGCKNITLAKIEFTLDEGPTGLSLSGTQLFCGFSNPTVAKLDTVTAILSKTNTANSLVWYASETATTPLPGNTPLVANFYFAAEKPATGCESFVRKKIEAIIQVFGPTILDQANQYSFCKNSTLTFSDLSISPYSYPDFVWLDAYKVSKLPTTKLIPGKYFAAQKINGCISDKSQEIEVKFESPIITIAPTKLPTCGVGNGALKVVGGVTGYTYKWSKNGTPMTDIGEQISNLPSDYTIKYSVIVEDTKGCKAYDTTQFSDCEPPGIPHVLTLNKDGKNDVFKLYYHTKYPNCKLSIFNRWGAMVFESKDIPYKDDWDGKPNVSGTLGSGELPTGTYFYLIDKGDGSALESGYIELVK